MLMAMSSMLMNKLYILNKVSLNRNTQKVRFHIDRNCAVFPEEQWFSICQFVVFGDFIEH